MVLDEAEHHLGASEKMAIAFFLGRQSWLDEALFELGKLRAEVGDAEDRSGVMKVHMYFIHARGRSALTRAYQRQGK